MARTDPRVQTLSVMDVLRGTTPRELEQLCGLMTQVVLPAGAVLCRQGDYAREVFLVVEGQVAISLPDRAINVVGRGSLLGEMAMLDHQVRTATATALSEVTVLVMTPREFRELLATHPLVAANVQALAAARTDELAALCAA
jgi:CRP-like cAMP-binding protein